MGLRVHHLDCATMCPLAGGILGHPDLVGHCLLVETDAGLVLVDTGFGTDDPRRLPRGFRAVAGPTFPPEGTALQQVRRLGFRPDDVRHIVVTHLDLDHAGGLSDFPAATVHVQRQEHADALARRGLRARVRYLPAQWSHGPRWSLLDAPGEGWKGFRAVRDLPGLPPELLVVPLDGHTRGHQAVAVDKGDGWLLHVGDLWAHRGRLTGDRLPVSLAAFEWAIAADRPALRHNQARIRSLHRDHPDVRVFCAHDADDLRRMREVS